MPALTIVMTTIYPPSPPILEFSQRPDTTVIITGDKKTPLGWATDNVDYFAWDDYRLTAHHSYACTPLNHYSRKNLGYLEAMAAGAEQIFDTDDDNFPLPSFGFPEMEVHAETTQPSLGFINTYRLFTDQHIWPRGLPISQILRDDSGVKLDRRDANVGVWQGLANGDPDVDAIYRLTSNVPCVFRDREPVVLAEGTWSPFNSQNTLFRKELFPLLYLPVSVSFRFTDILRSFVAQPIMWRWGFQLGFTTATVHQDRNPHDYLDDFQSELPMYSAGDSLNEALVESQQGTSSILNSLARAYEALRRQGIVSTQEIVSLDAWLRDCEKMGYR